MSVLASASCYLFSRATGDERQRASMRCRALALVMLCAMPTVTARAQDSTGSVRVRVSGAGVIQRGAVVRSGRTGERTDSTGLAQLTLPQGRQRQLIVFNS